MKSYLRTHWSEKPFPCNQCHMTFSEGGSLKTHVWTHSCKQCPKVFSVSSSLKTHLGTHLGENSFPCNQYTKSF